LLSESNLRFQRASENLGEAKRLRASEKSLLDQEAASRRQMAKVNTEKKKKERERETAVWVICFFDWID
jgi:hypothetical protein